MPYVYSNRATAQLSQSLAPTDTNMIVQTGQGVTFPTTGGTNIANLTIVSADGTHEIVTNTSRTGDNFVITRGQEGTPAGSFPAGSRVELRLTAATLNSFLSKAGGVMTGPIDFNGQYNRNYVGFNANIEYIGTRAIVGYDSNNASAITFPGGGAWPRINGSKIMTWTFLAQAIFIYYGGIEFLPPFFKICDGSNGTPNLRDRFVICAGPGHPQFTAGGDLNLYMQPAGFHSHGGGVGGTQLDPVHLPALNPLAKAFSQATWAPGDYPNEANKRQILQDANVQGYTGLGAHHGHGIGGDGSHTHAGSYHPPYYSLYYVMLNEFAFT